MKISERINLLKMQSICIKTLDEAACCIEDEVFPTFDDFNDEEIDRISDQVRYLYEFLPQCDNMLIAKIVIGKYRKIIRHIRYVCERYFAMTACRVKSEELKECEKQI